MQNVALKKADFGIARLDEIVLAIDRGIPPDYGVLRSAADPTMIRQCFANSQPFYLEEMDVPVRIFLFSESGFDPGRVIYCNQAFLKDQPELVGKFIKASLDGWNSYMYQDRTATHARLLELNPRNTPELNALMVETSKQLHIL